MLDELVIPGSELWLFSEVSPVYCTAPHTQQLRHQWSLLTCRIAPHMRVQASAFVTGVIQPVQPHARVLCLRQVPIEEREQRLHLAAFNPATDVQNLRVLYKDPALEGGCMSRKQLSQIK